MEPWLGDGAAVRLGTHLGDASYAIYLAHPFVVEATRRLAPLFGLSIGHPVILVLCLILAMGVGSAVWTVVDRPLVAWARRRLTGDRRRGASGAGTP